MRHFHTDAHEIDVIPDGRWAAIEVKLGGQELIESGTASLLAAAGSIDPDHTPRPALNAAVSATGRYAYKREDGVLVLALGSCGHECSREQQHRKATKTDRAKWFR